ncbi:MAG: glycosyltransferase family 4 protein [Ignavibacteria bacterium]|nr:glycosyltransferase family 4 protein [Ignavibacteria bacterium]
MHILIVHQAVVSSKEPGGTRHFEFACRLVKEGHKCTIITSALNYLTGESGIATKKLISKENIDGLNIIKTYTYPTLHSGFISRIISFLSFMFTSVIAGWSVKDLHVVFGTSPPIFQAVSAWFISVLKRKPFLLEIRDLWPDFAIGIGILKNPILIRLAQWLERFLYNRANHIIVNSPAYKERLLGKGLEASKISLISNGVDVRMFDPQNKGKQIREKFNLSNKFVVTYAGALGIANDIPTILKAAKIIQTKNSGNVHFLLVGDGNRRKELENLARTLNLSNVTFAGSHPKSEMPKILAASDICVAILKDIPMFRTTYPNKVFDYMAAGRGIVLAIDGVIRKVVESASCGVFVPPGNEIALANAIEKFHDDKDKAYDMGLAGRNYVIQHFDRALLANKLISLLNKYDSY